MTQARAIMVLGTSSHVGKSLLTTALCRIFAQRGYTVAPFKSQNMSLNSAATIEGLEIGRAQALQAEAAGIAPSVHMNPILIKPSSDCSSQVIVRGKIWGQISAVDYHQRRVEELLPIVRESYQTLASNYQVIVLEGAGSPAEINLKQHDIVNMRMAAMADAQCLLVGDIDRGGVFASLLGTVELLEPEERERIRGFCINKFRGDPSLLEPGLRMMEQRLDKPCLGVVPYLPALALEEEDSVGLPPVARSGWGPKQNTLDRPLRIAVIALPSFSNFTDFDSLRAEPSVDLLFCRSADFLTNADIVILPGSKQTMSDLEWILAQRFDRAVHLHAKTDLVVGICGGMQMLGEELVDPNGIERQGRMPGLGLLPIRTEMQAGKVTRLCSGVIHSLFGQPVQKDLVAGYEIHVGKTLYQDDAEPFATLTSGEADGCVSTDRRVLGTYLHGIFDHDGFRHQFLTTARNFCQLDPPSTLNQWTRQREESLDRLARQVSTSLDMHRIFDWVGLKYA
ncbi:MAG: adenosylcobyric acid synthase [Acidobacteriaceae bacterium]|nr:adenosylcobyric acid synthase [Acidobacteriaceae bacterium]